MTQGEVPPIGKVRTIMPQILASSAKNLLLLDLGMAVSFPTIVIPALKGLKAHDNADFLSFTDYQASWFASIAFIFQPIGSVLSGIVLEPLGRKKSMILVNIPHILGWLLLFHAGSVRDLYIAAVLLGLGVGFMEAPIITYVGEICQPSIRGILTSCAGVAVMLGFTIVYFLGSITTWRVTALICCSIPIVTAVAICFVPETPFWLMARGRKEDALKSLMWLRGWVKNPKHVEKEFQEIQRYSEESNRCVNCQKTEVKVCSHKSASAAEIRKELLRKRTLKPFSLILMMFVFLQFSGLVAMRPYFVQLFQTFEVPIDASWATFAIGILGFVANIACTCLIKPLGKRNISLISIVGTFLSLLALSIYAFVVFPSGLTSFEKHNVIDVNDSHGYLPLLLIFSFAFFTSFGLIPIPWMLLSEVFPFKTRSVASGITAALNYVMQFIVTKSYFSLETTLSLFGVLVLFTIVDLIGLVYIYFYLPETEKRTLEEIELHFSDNNKKMTDIKIQKNDFAAKPRNGVENKGFEHP